MYKSEKIFPDTWRIIDAFDEALYLIEKQNHAFLIDTGMDHDSLNDYVKTLTDKPVVVLLTHGHIDHIGRCGEFETVCMSTKDNDIYQKHQAMAEGPQFVIRNALPDPFPIDMEGIRKAQMLEVDTQLALVSKAEAHEELEQEWRRYASQEMEIAGADDLPFEELVDKICDKMEVKHRSFFEEWLPKVEDKKISRKIRNKL